ncbi:MAG: hypothetical protein HC875_41335 [Anaerolineales bacterium]|nr:hypothetical protein [Anaerolineales bacterium]
MQTPLRPQLLQQLLRLIPAFLLAMAFLGLAVPILAANPGDLDPSFGNNGVVTTTIDSEALAYAMAIQADGKIIVAGASGTKFFNSNLAVSRYTITGSLDSTFGGDGVVTTSIGSNSSSRAVAVQPDGKIVAGGVSSGIPDRFALARYTITGTLDNTFGNNGSVTTTVGTNGSIMAIAIQPDSKIIAVGSGTSGGQTVFALARYTVTGSMDSTFGYNGIVTTPIGSNASGRAVVLQSDGKILVAGRSSIGNLPLTFALTRYTITGSLDSTFGNSGVVTTSIGNGDTGLGVTTQPDGKIIVVGASDLNALSGSEIALASYTITGTLDSTFGKSGIVTTSIANSAYATDVTIQPDGQIIVIGGSQNSFALVRYNNDGTLDSEFGSSGIITTPIGTDAGGESVALQSDGKIIAAGPSSDGSHNMMFTVVRYLSNPSNSNTPQQTYLPLVIKQ